MVVKKKKQDDEGVSFAPQDQVASSGLLNDVDADFTEVECTTFDYNGKVKDEDGNIVEVPALRIKMTTDDGQESEQYLPAGSLDKLTPSDDGTTFVPAEGSAAKGIPSKSNLGIFMRSLGDAGFPFSHDEGLPDDISPRDIKSMLEGGRFHILRVEAPKRGGMARSEKQKKYPDEVLTVTEVVRKPWDKPAKKGAKAVPAKGNGKAKAAKEEEEETEEASPEDLAAEVVGKLLASPKHKKGISTDDISELLWEATQTHPSRKAILKVVQEDGYFEGRDEFELDEDGLITLA